MDTIKVRDAIVNLLTTESDFKSYNFSVNCNEITIEDEKMRKPLVKITLADLKDGKEVMREPTEKQLRYISNLQRYRVGVPEFDGKTIKDASEFISKYKDSPNREFNEDKRPEFCDDDYPEYDMSDIDSLQESLRESCLFG